MADEEKKNDWSMIESMRRTSKPASPASDARAAELVRSVTTTPLSPKQEMAVALPPPGAAQGLLMEYRSKKMARKATLEALGAQYNAAIDILKHRLQKTVQGQNARADVDYETYIRQLDQEYLEVLAGLGLRNKDVRERTLIQLTDMTAAKLKEVQAADWPKELKEATINDLFALRERFASEMMRELGSQN